MDDPGGEAEREVEALKAEFDQYVRERTAQILTVEIQRSAQMVARAEADRLRVEVAALRDEVAQLRSSVRALGRAPRGAEPRGLPAPDWRERLGALRPRSRTAWLLSAGVALAVVLLIVAGVVAANMLSAGRAPPPGTTASLTSVDDAASLEQGLARLRGDAGIARQLCGAIEPCTFDAAWLAATAEQQTALLDQALARLEIVCAPTAAWPAEIDGRVAQAATCRGALQPAAEPYALTRWAVAQVGAAP